MKIKVALFALLGLTAGTPAAFGQFFYLVQKQQNVDQTGNSTTTPDANPYRFSVQISGGSQSDTNPTPPNQFYAPDSGAPTLLSAPSVNQSSQWTYRQNYSTQGAMDTAFPNGNYTISFGSDTGTIALNGDLYPNAPLASFNVAGTWSGNTYNIFAGQSLTITVTFSNNFTSGSDRIEEDASPEFGNGTPSSLETDTGPSFTNNTLSMTIPGSELQAGDVWDISSDFDAFSSLNTIGNSTGVGLYSSNTEFHVAAIPEPGEAGLLAGVIGLGFAAWRRRKVKA